MFTGIITETTEVLKTTKTLDGIKVTFKKPPRWTDLKQGESVSTDGVCLTVSALRKAEYDCDLMAETLSKTTFGQTLPKIVNLERPMQMNDRFGGHFVQGHVDEFGKVTKIDKSNGTKVYIKSNPKNKNLVAAKGSIAVNGVSLTVIDAKEDVFSLALIPFTLDHTNLGTLKEGDLVNIEFDMLAKQIVRILDNAKG